MNIISLDLELNQLKHENGVTVPKIIQIGAVIGNPANGEIVERIDIKVNPEEKLTQEIIELTGITQEQVDRGVTILEAYEQLKVFKKKHQAHRMLVTWGAGDSDAIRRELPHGINWVFGFRHIDVKTLAQSYCLINSITMKGGLEPSMKKFGLTFEGRPHDGLDDAYNTFKVYCWLLEKLKEKTKPI